VGTHFELEIQNGGHLKEVLKERGGGGEGKGKCGRRGGGDEL
jgi:hypothetical protein